MSISNMSVSQFSRMADPQLSVHKAAAVAKVIAQKHIANKIQKGLIDRNDQARIADEFKSTYYTEYYKYCAQYYKNESPRIVYIQPDSPSKKFPTKHTVANFSKLNCLVHVHRGCITVGRVKFPIDEDVSPETKEAFLCNWPGPLDQHDDQLKRNVTFYIDTLWQHDSQRTIKYNIDSYDRQRKTILKLLTELLRGNGNVDAPTIARLLLDPDQTDIQRDESNKRPLETLQKCLLLGKRTDAIRFARSSQLWDHAQCLAFLDKYQPQKNIRYVSDGLRLKDDSIVQLNEEFVRSLKQGGILQTVYRCLLGRIYESDPDSGNIIKPPNVGNKSYEFAMLSANDCDMEFDESNEVFKLIIAAKKAPYDPVSLSHIISLGHSCIETNDSLLDDTSYRSQPTFKPGDTHASRTLTISNLDMLILNEVWEYCLNLARGSYNRANHEYLIDLLPYKLVFASKLLDFGRHEMFSGYLRSIWSAYKRIKEQPELKKDPFYDWDAMGKSIEILSEIHQLLTISGDGAMSPGISSQPHFVPESQYNPVGQQMDMPVFSPPSFGPPSVGPPERQPPETMGTSSPVYNHRDSIQSNANMDSFNAFSPISDYDSDYRKKAPLGPESQYNPVGQQMDMPVFSPPSFGPPSVGPPERQPPETMGTSSPVYNHRDSIQSNANMDSFNAFSPINDYDELPRPARNKVSTGPHDRGDASASGGMLSNNEASNTDDMSKSNPSGGQSGFLTNLVGSAKALLPKSNSKPMILPDDRSKPIVFDEKKKKWVDTTKGESLADEDFLDAPPMMRPSQEPVTYSRAPKTTRARYPIPPP